MPLKPALEAVNSSRLIVVDGTKPSFKNEIKESMEETGFRG